MANKKRSAKEEEDFIESFVDYQIQMINDAGETSDRILGYHGPDEDRSLTDEEKLQIDVEEILKKIQSRTVVLTYKSSKRLEKYADKLNQLTRVLLACTIVLAILTLVLVFSSLHIL